MERRRMRPRRRGDGYRYIRHYQDTGVDIFEPTRDPDIWWGFIDDGDELAWDTGGTNPP